MSYEHITIMLREVVHFLNPKPGKVYVDGTLGGAGHSSVICEKILPTGILIGIDKDIDAISNAKQVLKPYASNIRLFHNSFVHLDRILNGLNLTAVDGILLDLGLSLHHLESSSRGFSFKRNEPLDMRMDIHSNVRAEDLVNEMTEDSLAKLFKELGEERWARRIAKKISIVRKQTRIKSSRQLEQIVWDTIPRHQRFGRKIHPATKVFMALRIAVNQELETLANFMETVAEYLNPGARLCVLSYHSLEDRIIKNQIKANEKGCTCPPGFPECVCHKKAVMKVITRRVLRPTADEVARNPMARSARMRVAEKL